MVFHAGSGYSDMHLLPSSDAGDLIGVAFQKCDDVHQRQTSAPQLVVRLADPSSEAAYQHEASSLAPFRLTLAGAWAAMPNLLAEMLHPTSHWSLHVDNDVAPTAAHGSAAAAEQAKIQRSGASAEGSSELQAAPLFARTDSASSL